jgi:hypothetical protein
VSILLRLFVASAVRVQQWRVSQVDVHSKDRQFVEGLHINRGDCEALQGHIIAAIPQLVTRFRGDEDSVEQLIDLLGCCDVPFSSGSGGSSKIMQSLVKVATDMFDNCQQEQALTRLAGVFRSWLLASADVSSVKGKPKASSSHVRSVVSKLITGVFDKWSSSVAGVVKEVGAWQSGGASVASSASATNKKKRESAGSAGGSGSQQNVRNISS